MRAPDSLHPSTALSVFLLVVPNEDRCVSMSDDCSLPVAVFLFPGLICAFVCYIAVVLTVDAVRNTRVHTSASQTASHETVTIILEHPDDARSICVMRAVDTVEARSRVV